LQSGTKPSGVAIADFQRRRQARRGRSYQGDDTVSVILTKSDGTFAVRTDYPVGKVPLQVVTSDFNGDGIMDLAVVNSADNTISVLFGAGDGTFKSQVNSPQGEIRSPSQLATSTATEHGPGRRKSGDDTVSVL